MSDEIDDDPVDTCHHGVPFDEDCDDCADEDNVDDGPNDGEDF